MCAHGVNRRRDNSEVGTTIVLLRRRVRVRTVGRTIQTLERTAVLLGSRVHVWTVGRTIRTLEQPTVLVHRC